MSKSYHRTVYFLSLVVLACGGASSTGPQPITGQYTSANAFKLSVGVSNYSLDQTVANVQQQVEGGFWTRNGNSLTFTASTSSAVSTLMVGDGTLDGFIYGTQRHFSRTGP